jgi:hypothetical protein
MNLLTLTTDSSHSFIVSGGSLTQDLICSMIINNGNIKERLKNFVRKRKNHFKYQKMDKDESTPKRRSLGKVIANLFQRFLSVFVRFVFKNIIYGERGQSMPPIKNLLLLEPATVLAMKIRTKKVC